MKKIIFILIGLLEINCYSQMNYYEQDNENINNFNGKLYKTVKFTTDIRFSMRPCELKQNAKLYAIYCNYPIAINYYIAYFKVCNKASVAFTIAEMEKKMFDYRNAEIWYEKSYLLNPYDYCTLLYLAQTQKYNGKYYEALNNFLKLKEEFKNYKSQIRKLIDNEIMGCQMAISFFNFRSDIYIYKLKENINSNYLESSPLLLDDYTLLYSSSKSNNVKKFYIAQKIADQWIDKGEFNDIPFNKLINNANGTYSLDKKRFYFTQSFVNWQNKVISYIYVSEYYNGRWNSPRKLDFPININNYSSTHPFITIDFKTGNEVLYFSSNRPCPYSKGGFDIWVAVFNKRTSSFGLPKNCGNKINSSADEITPFYDLSSQTLYYSSNGKIGFGGFDIYKSEGRMNEWTESINIGQPFNSSTDDFDFILSVNDNEGFFVSNRYYTGENSFKNNSDDIYYFIIEKQNSTSLKYNIE